MKYRAQFRLPDHRVLTLESIDVDETLEQQIERWRKGHTLRSASGNHPEQAELIFAQTMPEETTDDQIRYCPFCGSPFQPSGVPGVYQLRCDECENVVIVSLHNN